MKTILLIITGGIAAYKALELIRLIRGGGMRVIPVMSKGAGEFVTPLSVSALAEEPVRSELFDLEAEAKMGHIELARAADLIVVAPASADFLAKLAHGRADDLASTIVLASRAGLLIAPAMNVAMWEAEATKANIATLKERGACFVGPEEGDMACGEYGMGRMAEVDTIMEAIFDHHGQGAGPLSGRLSGRKFIITSGPTHEPIDPVRYIANRSSGRQGTAIAEAISGLGGEVVLVSGPAQVLPNGAVDIVQIETAEEMHEAVFDALPADCFIGVAAVADWRVKSPQGEKIKKGKSGAPSLEFAENPDILAEISSSGQRPGLVIGFAAETQNVIEHARAKREKKGCDWLLANDVSAEGGAMGGDVNQIHFLGDKGEENWPEQSKSGIARMLAAKIADHFENVGQTRK